eukprot:TRINITY_DN7346_c0_g1_i1.p1 TRINITY_DN7346_c0_g1~~TRINITY_DN7346_c0_g1_i1.p1  ORF type:complete len:562 (-),score=56.32 TRINITY_DN7346_c0_g1_i1:2475-4160(-)
MLKFCAQHPSQRLFPTTQQRQSRHIVNCRLGSDIRPKRSVVCVSSPSQDMQTSEVDSSMLKYVQHVFEKAESAQYERVQESNQSLSELREVLKTVSYLEKKSNTLKQEMEEVNQLLGITAKIVEEHMQGQGKGLGQQQLQAIEPKKKEPTKINGHPLISGLDKDHPGHVHSGNFSKSDEDILMDISGPGVTVQPSHTVCAVQHPGALCCTSTNVAQNPEEKTVMLTIKTVARCTMEDSTNNGGRDTDIAESSADEDVVFTMNDMSALAAQALLSAAQDYSRSQTRSLTRAIHSEERLARHEEICKILSHGHILNAERIESQFGHTSYTVELKSANSDRRIKALFKPRVKGDADGWHRVPIEWVAYKLNLMLGMDYVPPVGYRVGGVDVDYTHYDEGAFIYFADDAQKLKKFEQSTWSVSKSVLLSDTRILDVLLHNSDRHHGHFLLGQHWVEGHHHHGKWSGRMRPILIDHAAGFRKEACVTMEHENAFQTGAVRTVSARTYLRLRFMDAASIASKFSEFLTEREMREMLHRRNYILKYLDSLVAENGYSATVFEAPHHHC